MYNASKTWIHETKKDKYFCGNQKQKYMKYIIQNAQFTYEVDWSKLSTEDGGFIDEYFPSPKESIEAFLSLLENIHSPKAIADALAEGLDAMDNSPKGVAAKKKLVK